MYHEGSMMPVGHKRTLRSGTAGYRGCSCGCCVQVLSSLLLALQAQGEGAVAALGASLSHVQALLDCLGELPSGERGVGARGEVGVWPCCALVPPVLPSSSILLQPVCE